MTSLTLLSTSPDKVDWWSRQTFTAKLKWGGLGPLRLLRTSRLIVGTGSGALSIPAAGGLTLTPGQTATLTFERTTVCDQLDPGAVPVRLELRALGGKVYTRDGSPVELTERAPPKHFMGSGFATWPQPCTRNGAVERVPLRMAEGYTFDVSVQRTHKSPRLLHIEVDSHPLAEGPVVLEDKSDGERIPIHIRPKVRVPHDHAIVEGAVTVRQLPLACGGLHPAVGVGWHPTHVRLDALEAELEVLEPAASVISPDESVLLRAGFHNPHCVQVWLRTSGGWFRFMQEGEDRSDHFDQQVVSPLPALPEMGMGMLAVRCVPMASARGTYTVVSKVEARRPVDDGEGGSKTLALVPMPGKTATITVEV